MKTDNQKKNKGQEELNIPIGEEHSRTEASQAKEESPFLGDNIFRRLLISPALVIHFSSLLFLSGVSSSSLVFADKQLSQQKQTHMQENKRIKETKLKAPSRSTQNFFKENQSYERELCPRLEADECVSERETPSGCPGLSFLFFIFLTCSLSLS